MPERTCVACRTRRPKAELVRIVRGPAGSLGIDEGGRLPGRGAYLCADGACWTRALHRSALQRALRVPLPADLKERLEHGAVVTTPPTTGPGAAHMMLGGNHGP